MKIHFLIKMAKTMGYMLYMTEEISGIPKVVPTVLVTQDTHLCYSIIGALFLSYGYYYDYYRVRHLYKLNCNGTEDRLLDCPYIENGPYCSQYSDAAIMGQARLTIICQCM